MQTNFNAVSKAKQFARILRRWQAKTYSANTNLLERVGISMLNLGSTRTAERRLVVETGPHLACVIGQKNIGQL